MLLTDVIKFGMAKARFVFSAGGDDKSKGDVILGSNNLTSQFTLRIASLVIQNGAGMIFTIFMVWLCLHCLFPMTYNTSE